jgi:DNA-binding transcriptional MocR family regulator
MMSDLLRKYLRGRTAVKIAAGVEHAVREGRLRPGDRLPTVRKLADSLHISPTTVSAAYRRLGERGVAVAEGRRGTRISERPALVSRPAPAVPPDVRNLADGNPDPSLLPDLQPVLAALAPLPRLYGETANLPELVTLASRELRRAGAPRAPVAVVSGALDGIERVLQAHLKPGDRVAVEDPGFADVIDLTRAIGLVPVPVAVDDKGPRPDSLQLALDADVQGCVFTPRAQNPTGAALDRRRAAELRRILRNRPDLLVIEDDHAGPIAGAPAASLCTAARRRWAILHSVCKSLGPDLRLAFLTGDTATVARVEGRQRLGASWVSHLLQSTVYLLLSKAGTKAHLRRVTRTYASRRQALLDALATQELCGQGRSGLNVWIPVPDESRTIQLLFEAGWAVAPGTPFRLKSPPAIRVTTAALAPRDARRFARDLAAILRSRKRTHAA